MTLGKTPAVPIANNGALTGLGQGVSGITAIAKGGAGGNGDSGFNYRNKVFAKRTVSPSLEDPRLQDTLGLDRSAREPPMPAPGPNGALAPEDAVRPNDGSAAPPPAPAPATPASAQPATAKSAYPPPAPVPTQAGSRGIRFDFNLGCRVTLPAGAWHVRLSDLDTGNTLFETDSQGSFINSTKRYFVRFAIEVWEGGNSVFRHEYAATGRDVLVQFPVGTVGDIVGWFPYAVKFKEQHAAG
jgi:hypothetical protein